MSNVPQPKRGSVVLKLPEVPHELTSGLYLDEDIALYVSSDGVQIVAPDHRTAELIASSLHRTAWNWRGNLISEQDLVSHSVDYAAWLKLAAKLSKVGEQKYESRESEEVAKTVSRAAS